VLAPPFYVGYVDRKVSQHFISLGQLTPAGPGPGQRIQVGAPAAIAE
jgi:hypothetical protein